MRYLWKNNEGKAIKRIKKIFKLWDKSLVIPGKKNEVTWEWFKVTVSLLLRLCDLLFRLSVSRRKLLIISLEYLPTQWRPTLTHQRWARMPLMISTGRRLLGLASPACRRKASAARRSPPAGRTRKTPADRLPALARGTAACAGPTFLYCRPSCWRRFSSSCHSQTGCTSGLYGTSAFNISP